MRNPHQNPCWIGKLNNISEKKLVFFFRIDCSFLFDIWCSITQAKFFFLMIASIILVLHEIINDVPETSRLLSNCNWYNYYNWYNFVWWTSFDVYVKKLLKGALEPYKIEPKILLNEKLIKYNYNIPKSDKPNPIYLWIRLSTIKIISCRLVSMKFRLNHNL